MESLILQNQEGQFSNWDVDACTQQMLTGVAQRINVWVQILFTEKKKEKEKGKRRNGAETFTRVEVKFLGTCSFRNNNNNFNFYHKLTELRRGVKRADSAWPGPDRPAQNRQARWVTGSARPTQLFNRPGRPI